MPSSVLAAGVEPSDAPAGKVALVLAGLIAMVLVALLFVFGTVHLFGGGRIGALSNPVADRLQPMPAPRLQLDPAAERIALEATARANLAGQNGQMPIDEAMRITSANGWRNGGNEQQ